MKIIEIIRNKQRNLDKDLLSHEMIKLERDGLR